MDEIWRYSPPVYLGLLEDKRAEDAVLEREKARIAHVKSSAEHVAPAVEFKTRHAITPSASVLEFLLKSAAFSPVHVWVVSVSRS